MNCNKSSGKKIFYPVREETLCAVLDNVRHVLKVVTDIFTFKESILLRSGFLLVVEQVLFDVVKEVEATGGLSLDSAIVSASSQRSVSLDADMLLTMVLDLSLQKTAFLIGKSAIDGDAQAALEKEIAQMESNVELCGAVTSSLLRSFMDIGTPLVMQCEVCEIEKLVDIDVSELAARISSEFDLMLTKPVCADYNVTFAASLSCVVRRYRTLGDLDGLTLADVKEWDLNQFYYLEV